MRSTHLAVSLGTTLFMASGCGGDAVPEPRSPADRRAAPATTVDPGPRSTSTVQIAADIRKACGIAETDAHFPFDSATVLERDRRVLGQLATCFVSGPLAGRGMRLVGHTDPRGDTDFTFVPGGQRADSVKGVLLGQGLPAERVASTSRGELDADGVDEASWRDDRRVDVMLAQ